VTVFSCLALKGTVMDETLARERLDKSEALVEQEVQEIAKHRLFIEHLKNGGHETNQAERSLAIMERSLAALKHHRHILLEHLGLYEAGESGANVGLYPGPPIKGQRLNRAK
jgi:hypothetical protein